MPQTDSTAKPVRKDRAMPCGSKKGRGKPGGKKGKGK